MKPDSVDLCSDCSKLRTFVNASDTDSDAESDVTSQVYDDLRVDLTIEQESFTTHRGSCVTPEILSDGRWLKRKVFLLKGKNFLDCSKNVI